MNALRIFFYGTTGREGKVFLFILECFYMKQFKSYILFFIFSCVVSLTGISQLNKTDSLFQEWNNPLNSISERAESLFYYTWNTHLDRNSDSAIYWSLVLIDFTEKNNLIKEKAKALNMLGLAYRNASAYDLAIERLKEALALRLSIDDKIGAGNTLNNIATCYEKVKNQDSTIAYYSKTFHYRKQIPDSSSAANSLFDLALYYHNNSKHEAAIELYSECIDWFVKLKKKTKCYYAYLNSGDIYTFKKEYTKAKSCYKKAVELAIVEGNKKNTGLCYNRLADVANFEYEYSLSEEYSLKAIAVWNELNDASNLSTAYSNLAELYFKRTDYGKSIDLHKQCIALDVALKDSLGIRYSLTHIANAFHQLGQADSAVAYCVKSLKLSERIKSKRGLIANYNLLAQMNYDKADYAVAKDDYLKVLGLLKEDEITFQKAQCYNNVATCYVSLGEKEKALYYLKKCFEINNEIKDKTIFVSSSINYGKLYKENADFEKAISYFKAAKDTAERYGFKYDHALCLNNLATVYSNLGQTALAFDCLEKSLALSKEMKNKKRIASAYLNLGAVYSKQSFHDRALECYEQSLALAIELNAKEIMSSCYANIGILNKIKGNVDEAIKFQEKAITIDEETGNKYGRNINLLNIGNCYMEKRDTLKALYYQHLALLNCDSIDDKSGVASVLYNISNLYKNDKVNRVGIGYARKSFEKANELGVLKGKRNAALYLYRNYIELGEIDSAYFYLSILIDETIKQLNNNYYVLSEFEKELYFNSLYPSIDRYFDFAISYHSRYPQLIDSVYNLALLVKGIGLRSGSKLRSTIAQSKDTALVSLFDEWMSCRKKITKYYMSGGDTKQLESQAQDMERKLNKLSAAFNDFNSTTTLNWRNVKDRLKNNEASIEFIRYSSIKDNVLKNYYAALVVKNKSSQPELIRLCSEDDLLAVLGKTQGNDKTYIDEVYGSEQSPKHQLYSLLWKPLEASLSDVNTLYYSFAGMLHKVSLAAVYTNQNELLSTKFNLIQLNSTAQINSDENDRISKASSYFLVGGVEYSKANNKNEVWSYLPGSLEEVNSIYAFLNKSNQQASCYLKEKATEEIVKNEIRNANIVHIATHGFFFPDPELTSTNPVKNDDSPKEVVFRSGGNYAYLSFVKNQNPLMRSGIVLAAANDVWQEGHMHDQEDGILTALEVATIDLSKTKLVVLSACESGLGDIKGSEGVYGLQRSFKVAGVNYLMMSLWKVPDKETSEFMQNFYATLRKTKHIEKAFKLTQQAMSKKYDPYYWAAFVLIH